MSTPRETSAHALSHETPPVARLNIALVAPLVSPIADPFSGGSQALLFDLAAGLAQLGHGVTLLAADGSHVPGVEVIRLGIDSAQLRPTHFTGSHPPDPALTARERAYFLRIAYEIRRRAAEFDVVHNHAFDAHPFELLSEAHGRVIHTLHLPPVVSSVCSAAHQATAAGALLVTVSHWAAQNWWEFVGPTRVIRNGVPTERIPFGGPKEGWLFVGRIAPEKGLADALTAAGQVGRRLRIIGPVYDHSYYEQVHPQLRSHEVLGLLERDAVFAKMAAAEGLLMPVHWDEPFGLTAVECMAAGTPVAAYARGALAEVIVDQKTGFLVRPGDISELTRAAEAFHAIDPLACRRWVEETFPISRTVTEYARVYEELRDRG